MTDAASTLPPTLNVFERGWLSSNSVLCMDDGEATLIDTGYVDHAQQTLALVRHALGNASLTRVINTHLHSDHCGGNAVLQDAYGCRTEIPAAEARKVATWDETALSFRATGQACPRFNFDGVLHPGDTLRLGGFDWQALAAPGHDPHALMLYAPAQRILISGDALWENGFGVIFPELEGESGFAEQSAVLDLIASLDVALVIPGHGPVFSDVDGALNTARSRLDYLQGDPRRNALHAVKVLIKFRLLQTQNMTTGELLAWMQQATYLEDIRARHFAHAAMETVMDEGIRGLLKAKAATFEHGRLINLD